jgi:CheY-like chemotaxis protein
VQSNCKRLAADPAIETAFLNLSSDISAALFVIIPQMINPSAHGIALHEASLIGLQKCGHGISVVQGLEAPLSNEKYLWGGNTLISAGFHPILRPKVCSRFMSRPTILCVDDYETSLAGWCLYLQHAGYSVTTARTAQEGLERFAVSPVDLVLLDYAMPDMNGDDVAATMKRIKPDVRILMFSGVSDVPENARLHVDAFLQKGQSPTVVLDKIQELLQSSGEAA